MSKCKKTHYKSGVMLAEIGKESKLTGIVLNGTIEEYMYDEAGNQVNICRFNSGKVFGAELVCTSFNNSPVTLETKSECDVLLLNCNKLMSEDSLMCPCRMQMTANVMQNMASQLVFFKTKIRILAQKRLRDRLMIYLQTLTPNKNGYYNLTYNRTELADYLCVDRSALSRELCRMRDEKILDFSGKKIKLYEK